MASESLEHSTKAKQARWWQSLLFWKWIPVWYEAGPVRFAAFKDRLHVVEDKFRSGYECAACDGEGKVKCKDCGGTGRYTRGERIFNCAQCTDGVAICQVCHGKGGLLVVAEQSQRRPSTGRIVSVGHKVRHFKVGESVLYSNFAGHAMELPFPTGIVVLRILHENEILSKVAGHLELRAVRHQHEALTT